ncbi:MAG: TSUP family transporter [Halobacteriaceae archaeon]
MAEPTLSLLVVIGAVVFLGGVVKGIAGFGYAIASTALLASFLSPVTAITVMIVPMLLANVTLLRELGWTDLRTCLRRFWPYAGAAMVGTAVGMVAVESVPTAALTVGLGVFTLAYVVVNQPWVVLPGEATVVEYCFTPGVVAKAGVGFVSGVIFGASNVAVQVVAYLDSLSLDRPTFVGVLAMMLVGVSGLRVGLAWSLGFYESGAWLAVSAIVAGPGLLGVVAGDRVRSVIPATYETVGVLGLLSVIGLRLVLKGI